MTKDKLRGLDPAEMQNRLREIDEQMFRLKFQMSMGQAEGLKKARDMRKERARLLTYARERELAGSTAAAAFKPQVTGPQGDKKRRGAK